MKTLTIIPFPLPYSSNSKISLIIFYLFIASVVMPILMVSIKEIMSEDLYYLRHTFLYLTHTYQ